jgi:hypothetical protein
VPSRERIAVSLHELPQSAHPKILALHAYWQKIAPGRGLLPGRQHVDPAAIPSLLPNLWLFDVLREPMRFRFRLIGTAIDRRGLPAKPGDFLEPLLAKSGAPQRVEDFERVANERRLLWYRRRPVIRHDRELAELEGMLLPLASDGVAVDMIMGLTVFYDSAGKEI